MMFDWIERVDLPAKYKQTARCDFHEEVKQLIEEEAVAEEYEEEAEDPSAGRFRLTMPLYRED